MSLILPNLPLLSYMEFFNY